MITSIRPGCILSISSKRKADRPHVVRFPWIQRFRLSWENTHRAVRYRGVAQATPEHSLRPSSSRAGGAESILSLLQSCWPHWC